MIRFSLPSCAVVTCVLSCVLLGCGQHAQVEPLTAKSSPAAWEEAQSSPAPDTLIVPETEDFASCIDPIAVRTSERNRAGCYRLQPARSVVITTGKHQAKTRKSAQIAVKKSQKKSATAPRKPPQKTVRTVGLCQPQSLIYARCRTGINTCRLGNTSPVQWFACARNNGATTARPVAGSVIVLAANTRRGMPTGHPAYVEEVRHNSDGTWTLRISHTNYDRKCHLDLDAKVLFFPSTMTASFVSGHWSAWAKHLKVQGFIIR